jgi:hypothetical protein
MNANGTRNAPWWEAMVTFDVLAGGSLALVALWASLVCEVSGSLLFLAAAGALVAASGALLADGTQAALGTALYAKVAAATLLGLAACAEVSLGGLPGWQGLGAGLVLAEAGLLARES